MTDPTKAAALDHGETAKATSQTYTGRWILLGLLAGLLCGVLFGEYCGSLRIVGKAYVGLLQMTVLPYLVFSLVSKLGRLRATEAKRLGLVSIGVLLILWLVGIVLIVLVSGVLPPMEGASFFSPEKASAVGQDSGFTSNYIPANVFRSLSSEYVPAVVVFCLFFGSALMFVPGKEPLLDFLDVCLAGIGSINAFLVRLAPFGLFALTADAAGTLHVDEMSRLQAYLIMFTLACAAAAFAFAPLLLSSVTQFRYRQFLHAAQAPMLTAIATGKLFVVLPQIVESCEQLAREGGPSIDEVGESIPSVVVPLAYPFPHLGKILTFVFIPFAAWYTGQSLTPAQTAAMAATGTLSSFASPLVSIPYLLDQYQLPQDLLELFILPGFITTRLADVVGVAHLMVLSLIVTQVMQGRLQIRWGRMAMATAGTLICLIFAVAGCRGYLASTTLEYNLDQQFLSLEIPDAYDDVVVFKSPEDVPSRPALDGSTIERVKTERVLRVGYDPDRLPYSFFNSSGHLVGIDVELMHRLARLLQARLEFIPVTKDAVIDQLDAGQIDVAIGGIIMNPRRLLRGGFTCAYDTATAAIVLPDYRRGELVRWDDPHFQKGARLGVNYEDFAVAAHQLLPNTEIVVVDTIGAYFTKEHKDLDGLLVAAEVGAAWNVLYPNYSVVVPKPVLQRPVSMIVRLSDSDWLRFLDRWLDFERLDGTLEHLRVYWVEGGGTRRSRAAGVSCTMCSAGFRELRQANRLSI